MTLRMALRALAAQPVRSAVLACGFGMGITAMAGLLGVGEVILEQSRAPGLWGGGDVRVTSSTSDRLPAPRFILWQALGDPELSAEVRGAAPFLEKRIYLVEPSGETVAVDARGGIPSLERAIGDPETSALAVWRDTAIDLSWTERDPDRVLRDLDRFHAIPEAPDFEDSWAEWLYFNGTNGDARFYLTFLVGPRAADPTRRVAGVRLQLDDGARQTDWFASDELDEAELLARAPDLEIGGNRIALVGRRYEIDLRLRDADGKRELTGRLSLAAPPGRSMLPIEIPGARGWLTGYVVPVLSGELQGRLQLSDTTVSFDGGHGYHDHNWGFWKGVTWQWGQATAEGLSFVWGRVRPPVEAADPDRFPAFFVVRRPDAPVAYSLRVTIEETEHPTAGRPQRISIGADGNDFELAFDLEVETAVRNPPVGPIGDATTDVGLVQMRGTCHISGTVGDRTLDVRTPASAETFR